MPEKAQSDGSSKLLEKMKSEAAELTEDKKVKVTASERREHYIEG